MTNQTHPNVPPTDILSMATSEQHISTNNHHDNSNINSNSNTNTNISTNSLLPSETRFNETFHSMLLARIAEEYQNQTHWFGTKTVIALIIAYCLVITAGFLGNAMVVLVMLRHKDLRTSRNLYILNLSICDIVMCCFCMPFSLVKYILKKWMLGAAMCRVVPALATIDVFVSTFTIIAVAVDRYRSIVRACQERSRQKTHYSPYQVLYILVIIWAVSIALAAPLFIFHDLSTEKILGKPVFHTCIEIWPHDRFREVYSTLVSLVQYLTPTIVISGLHARICSFLQHRIHNNSPTSEAQRQRHQRQWQRYRKNLILLTSIAVSFSLAWLPLTLLNIIADWTHDNSIFGLFEEKQFYLAHAVSLLIAMTSSAINPLLYGWFNTNFRNAFLQILGRRKETSQESSSLKAGLGSGGCKAQNYDSLHRVGGSSLDHQEHQHQRGGKIGGNNSW